MAKNVDRRIFLCYTGQKITGRGSALVTEDENMKRWCILCLCLVLLLGGLTACKKKPADTSDPGASSSDTTKGTLPPAEDNGNDLVWGDDGLTPATTTTTKAGDSGKGNASDPSTAPEPTTTTPVKEEDGILLPAEGAKILPESHNGYKWLELGKSTHSGSEASIVLKNVSTGWETEQSKSFVYYACYDKNDKALGEGKVNFGRINPGESKTVKIAMPAGTAKLVITKAETEFWSYGWR